MTADEIRAAFLLDGLCTPGEIRFRFTDLDRLAAGGAVPLQTPLELPNHRETGRGFFLEQRELGAINIGGPGAVYVDSRTFRVEPLACIYAGVGTRSVVFESEDAQNPAKFFSSVVRRTQRCR